MVQAFPRITVVTPSYNQAQFLEATIRSVLDQDYANLEYLIYDGGSTDGSPDIIQKYAGRLAGWRSRRDDGQTAAIVEGWQAATGDVVCWLNSDDYFLPGALNRVAQSFRDHPEAMAVVGACVIVNEKGGALGEKYARSFNLPVLLSTSGGVPGQPAVFLRREVLEQAGYPDVNLHYVMDWEFWIRLGLRLTPGQMHVLPQPLAASRVWAGAKTQTGGKAICDEHRQVLTRLFDSGQLPADLQSLRIAAMAGTYYKQAYLEWMAGRHRAAWGCLAQARALSTAGLNLWQLFWWHARVWLPYRVVTRLLPYWRGLWYGRGRPVRAQPA